MPHYECRLSTCGKVFRSPYAKRFCSMRHLHEHRASVGGDPPEPKRAYVDEDYKALICQHCQRTFQSLRRKSFCSVECMHRCERRLFVKPQAAPKPKPAVVFHRVPENTHVPGSIVMAMLGFGHVVRTGAGTTWSRGVGNDAGRSVTARRV